MGIQVKINCKFYSHPGFCKNKKTKRSWLRLGTRNCCEYGNKTSCGYKESFPKPSFPPPPAKQTKK